jgi:hypothetical protein
LGKSRKSLLHNPKPFQDQYLSGTPIIKIAEVIIVLFNPSLNPTLSFAHKPFFQEVSTRFQQIQLKTTSRRGLWLFSSKNV